LSATVLQSAAYTGQLPGPRVLWLWGVYGERHAGRINNGSAETPDEAKAAWLYAFQGSAPEMNDGPVQLRWVPRPAIWVHGPGLP